MSLEPFFKYYGGKWRSAPAYPAPEHTTIVEPFAGSAGYSLRYPQRRIVLVEKSEAIAAVWAFLIRATPAEILSLPDLSAGEAVDDLPLQQEARWFIGLWLGCGIAAPRKHQGVAWIGGDPWENKMNRWGEHARRRVARQVGHIRHWRIIHGDYSSAPEIRATWHVDPPYQGMGKHYPHGCEAIDFAELAAWCRGRAGQVMVCENEGAMWLPFRYLGSMQASPANGAAGVSREAIWTNEPDRQGVLFA